jgi:hypothetical protein
MRNVLLLKPGSPDPPIDGNSSEVASKHRLTLNDLLAVLWSRSDRLKSRCTV